MGENDEGKAFRWSCLLQVNRQIKIEEVVNAEVSALSVLVLHLQDYFRSADERPSLGRRATAAARP